MLVVSQTCTSSIKNVVEYVYLFIESLLTFLVSFIIVILTVVSSLFIFFLNHFFLIFLAMNTFNVSLANPVTQ